jgi:hypothetical protein
MKRNPVEYLWDIGKGWNGMFEPEMALCVRWRVVTARPNRPLVGMPPRNLNLKFKILDKGVADL